MSTHLSIGGARSGKSRHAQDLVLATGLRPVYVATSAVADDLEFEARVQRHRRDRGEGWTTVEEPLDLVGALAAALGPDTAVVVDCLTLWLTNVAFAERDVEAETSALCALLSDAGGFVALVTNEVGQGIVPMHAMTRRFRDDQGRLNQAVAAAVDRVDLLVAGIPVRVKG